MFHLDIDCISCEDEKFFLGLIAVVLGCAIGLYLIKRYKDGLSVKKK